MNNHYMQSIRVGIVAKANIDSTSKSELSKILKETLQADYETPRVLSMMTMDMVDSAISGSSVKIENITFTPEVFFSACSAILSEGKGTFRDIALKLIPIVAAIFSSMKVSVEEEECFILFSLHNNGEKVISENDAFNLLSSDWKTYPQYQVDAQKFSGLLKRLANKKIINYKNSEITLVEKIIVRYK